MTTSSTQGVAATDHSASPDHPEPAPAEFDSVPSSSRQREVYYERFQPLLRGLVNRYGTDADIREELPGELYCRYNALLDKFDPQRGVPLSAYVIRNLTAAAYTFARSRWRRDRRETGGDAVVLDAVETTAGPHELVLGSEVADPDFLAALPQAVEGLPPRQREVVTHRYFEGWSFEEIAYALNIKPATCRSVLRHALNNLRSRLGVVRE